jgi:hypothetical protein
VALTRTRKAKVRVEYPDEYRRHLVASRNTPQGYDAALLEAAQRGKDDFKFFCEAILGMRVHSGQEDVIRLMNEKDYGALAAANGWGKTLFYALLTLWATFYKTWAPIWWQEYKAVVMGPELAQALITHNEIEQIRRSRHAGQLWRRETGGDDTKHMCLVGDLIIPFVTQNKHHGFAWKHNNSKMYFESAKEKASAIEGWAVNLIIFDEVRLELHLRHIVEEVFLARATRAPGMKIVLGSTPLQDSFDFMDYWERGERGDEGWWARSGSIAENIFIDPVYLEKLRKRLDPRVAEQILAGKFVEAPDSYFVRERIMACFADEPPSAEIERFTGRSIPGHIYVGGCDTAVSEGGDYSVVTIWDITEVPFKVIFEHVFPKGTSTSNVIAFTDILIQEFGCQIGYDGSGPLGVEFGLQVSLDSGWYVPVKFGGHSIGGISTQKADCLANFRYMVNNILWKAPNILGLKKEMIAYKFPKDDRLIKDRLMAQVYAAWIAKDYINLNLEGMKFNPMVNIYSGEAGPFNGEVYNDGMGATRRKYLEMVQRSKQVDDARRIAEEVSARQRS